MEILMVAAELSPYARAGETADAVAALSRMLVQLGHDVTVALPRYASFEDAVDRRYEESQLQRAPRALVEGELRHHLVEEADGWRYRYTQAAVVAAYGEMASPPPPFAAVRLPTLLVLGERSYLPYDHLLEAHTDALGDLLEVVTVPGGHTVLWDALDETADAVAGFLAPARRAS